MGIKMPSVNQVVMTAVIIVILFFIIKLLPLPDSVKNLFRV
jgi:hypothetical protein